MSDGWQRGTVARLCPHPAFSHVVAYTRQPETLALRGTADSRLLQRPADAAAGCRAAAPRPGRAGHGGRAGLHRLPPMTLGLAGASVVIKAYRTVLPY
jgi:hypothetical protein